jgi:hypothetical protein
MHVSDKEFNAQVQKLASNKLNGMYFRMTCTMRIRGQVTPDSFAIRSAW